MPLHSHLSSLTLVRLLQEWAPVPGEPSRQDVAERLGEWLSPFHSVQLDGALQSIASYGAARPASSRQRGQAVDGVALASACRRVKEELAALIASEADAEADYGPHHRRYVAIQKQMETRIGACRVHVRQALSKGSPRLRQLSALDGVMAEMLGEREQKLLASVPVYLERRFAHWRERDHGHPSVPGIAGIAEQEDENLESREQADAWLQGFQQDMRQMLLAELHVRMQAVLGLIEAIQEQHT